MRKAGIEHAARRGFIEAQPAWREARRCEVAGDVNGRSVVF